MADAKNNNVNANLNSGESPAGRDLLPDFSTATPDQAMIALTASLSVDQRVDLLLKTITKCRPVDTPVAPTVGIDERKLAAGLAEGLQRSLGTRANSELDKLKRDYAHDIYEVCIWLMKAESVESDVHKRISAVVNKGGELTDLATVRTKALATGLEGEDLWTQFVHLLCETVNADYLSQVPDSIQKPERCTTPLKAKRAVSKKFNAFVWLAARFPSLRDAAGRGESAKTRMFLNSLPERLEVKVESAMTLLSASDRTYATAVRVAEKQFKLRDDPTDDDHGAEAPPRKIARPNKPLRLHKPQVWPANAVEEHIGNDECQLCGYSGHTAQGCPMVQISAAVQQTPSTRRSPTIICYNCQGTGHMARECPHPRRVGNTTTGPADRRTCFHCHKAGHTIANCPDKMWQLPPTTGNSRGGPRRCYQCGQIGHLARDCPSRVAPPGPPNYPPPANAHNPLN